MSKKIFAFCGPSNSGKTTLIAKLSSYLHSKGFVVAIIKHDPKDKARFDVEGKDSYKFFQTGAKVAVSSPQRTTIFLNESNTIKQIASKMGDFDILLVESFRNVVLPRILVSQNGEISDEYLKIAMAIASGKNIQSDVPCFDINDIESIADFTLKNAIDYDNLKD